MCYIEVTLTAGASGLQLLETEVLGFTLQLLFTQGVGVSYNSDCLLPSFCPDM